MALLNCASKTLFVGNLHASLEETDLLDIFKQFGRIVECCKRWCHYGFIQFSSEDEAKQAYLSLNGTKVRGRPMRIEFQRKKLKNLQALFDSDSEQVFSSCSSEKQYSYEQDENMEYFNEKNIEKFFNELMDDSSKVVSQTKPLGSLDLNSSTHTKTLSSQRKLKIRLSLDKENIENINNTSKSTKLPIQEDCNFLSPVSVNSPSKKQYSTSVMLFRSINNSHTICVEPTDVLEPLNVGEFNEYKLFPNATPKKIQNDLKSVLESLQQTNDNEIQLLTSGGVCDYTPQSMSLSCSSSSSVQSSISNSPTNFVHYY